MIVAALGRSPGPRLRRLSGGAAVPRVGPCRDLAQGRAADPDRVGLSICYRARSLEHRRRGPVRRRRALRRRARRRPAWPDGLVDPAGGARGGRHRRRGLGGDPGGAAQPARRQRDSRQPDARLCRAIPAGLGRAGPPARSQRLQFSAERHVRRGGDAAADPRGRPGALGPRVRARRRGGRLARHVPDDIWFRHPGRSARRRGPRASAASTSAG